jgi:hypothetical protein
MPSTAGWCAREWTDKIRGLLVAECFCFHHSDSCHASCIDIHPVSDSRIQELDPTNVGARYNLGVVNRQAKRWV